MLKDMKNLWIIIFLMIGANALNAQVFSSENNELDTVKTNIRGEIFKTLTITVTENYNVPNFKRVDVTSACVNGIDNTITLPDPSEELRGYIIEVTHLDTSAAQSRTTTVETDGTSYHIYDNFTGDTLTFFNVYQSGQTVRFTLKEIEGVLRWVAVNLSPVVFGNKELTAVGKIRQGEDGDLYAYDSSVSGERKVQYQYTVKNRSDLLNSRARYGDVAIVADTFGVYSPYLLRLDSLPGFTVDSVSVIPAPNGYWHMLPAGGDKYMYSQFRELGEDGGEVINNALQYIYKKAIFTRSLAMEAIGEATDSTYSIIGSLFIDQQVNSQSMLEIPNMVELTGAYNNGPILEGSLSRPFPGIVFNMPNASDTCIVFQDKNGDLYSSNFYRAGKISNLIIATESQVSRLVYSELPIGQVMHNILLNGEYLCDVCFEATGTIHTSINNNRFTSCDTLIYFSNSKTSTTLTLNKNTLIRGDYGIVFDPYAVGTSCKIQNTSIENITNTLITAGPGNVINIDNFETESSGNDLSDACIKLGFGSKNIFSSDKGRFSISNSRFSGPNYDYLILSDTSEYISVANCFIDGGLLGVQKEFKTSDQTKILNVYGGFSVNTDGGSGETNGLIDSVNQATALSIINFNKRSGGNDNIINYSTELKPNLLKINDGGAIEVEVEGLNPGVLKLGDETFVVDNSIPINLQITNTEGIGYEKIYYSLMEAKNGGKITPNYSLIRFSNLSEDNTNDDNAVYTSEIDLRHGPNNLNVVSGYQTLSLFQNQTNTGTVSELNGFYLPRSSTVRGTYNITDFSGLRIKGLNQIEPTVNIANSYGIKIDDQNPFNDPDFNNVFAIHTGTGLVRFGDNLQLSTYGAGNKSATDLSKTSSGYLSEYATDGTLLESSLTIADFDTLQQSNTLPDASETVNSSDFTASLTIFNQVDCSAGTITVTPPPSPSFNDRFGIVDAANSAGANTITIDFTGSSQKIYGAVQDFEINYSGAVIEFIYMGSTTGWVTRQ